jgi:hypothetical protein
LATTARGTRGRKKYGLRVVLILALLLGAALYLFHYISQFPKELIELYKNNPDARSFVLAYPNHKDDSTIGELSARELSGGVPLLMQWDERWGYARYGSSVLGVTGCGPTCLSMVAVGLTGSDAATPAAVADFSERNGYYVGGVGTSWDLMLMGAAAFGLSVEQLPLSRETMTMALDGGRPLIVSLGPGDFTRSGHFIVITGYDAEGFIVNDPNSQLRSDERWSYTELAPQILSIWAYSAT